MIESTFSPLPEHPLPAPKILIVEYDGAVRASIVEGLKSKKRHRIYEASSLFAASQQLRTQVIDTLVLGYVNEKNVTQNGDLEEWLTKVISKVKRLILLTAESFDDPYMTLSFWTQEEIRSLIEQLPRSDLSESTLSQHSLDQTPWAHMQTPLTEPDLNIDTPIAPNTTHLYGRGHTTLQTSPATDIRSQSSSNHDEDQRDPPPAHWAEVSYCERPMRAKAIAHISSVAFEDGARHIVEDSLDTHPKEEEGSLILWVGPSDDALCKDLKRACQPLNFNLLITESAQQALKETRTRRFEVAFVYSYLSDMMGLSLVRSLRREVGEGLPIAFITPSRQVSDRVEAVHAGVSLFLNEAASVDLLTQSLRQLQSLGTHGSAKILVIDDDNAELGDHVTKELSHSTFQVSCLTSPLRILELLAEVQTDLLIIHADMAGLGGFEVCRTLRATPEWQSLPILLMGERSDEDIRIAAYKSGADDYLSSNADQTVLRACLEARLERSRMIQERADRDGLTGLLVRRAFNDALLSRMAAARRRGTSVAVCLLDLDHFKSINDTYGHIAGDRVLTAIGRLLSSSFRVEDLRGRWGGEEFVLAFSNEDGETACAILERVRREFIRFYFDGEHGERFQASFSAGIACFPEHGETIEDVFKVADKRLFKVKAAGRNQILATDDFITNTIEAQTESQNKTHSENTENTEEGETDQLTEKLVHTPPQNTLNDLPLIISKRGGE